MGDQFITLCLKSKIHCIRNYLPKSFTNNGASATRSVSSNLAVWTSISSAICAAISNPQNGKESCTTGVFSTLFPLIASNQILCSQLFPAALSVIDAEVDVEVVGPAITVITSCLDHNGKWQTGGGMEGCRNG